MEYESRGDRDKNLSREDYLDIIKLFLRDMINNQKTHGEWKIQLTMQITFISSLDTCIMHSKSGNAEIVIGIETDDIIFLAVKSLSRLLRGITSNHDGEFYCLDCFHSYSTNNKLKKNMKKYSKIMIVVV